MIYFTSDLHLGHANIIKHCNRPFFSVNEMTSVLIDNINKTVDQRKDELYILGDFTFYGGVDDVRALRNRIACRRVHFIRGNHDKDHAQHHIFCEYTDYKELRCEKRKLILFHYPILSWNGLHRTHVIHLHGHQHNSATYNKNNIRNGILRFDIGVDANDFKPVSADTIFKWQEKALKNWSDDVATHLDNVVRN